MEMTQMNYIVPPTRLMLWYEKQPNKSAALRATMSKTGVSVTYATNWMKGLCEPKKAEHRQALSEITGIKVNELFQLVENETA